MKLRSVASVAILAFWLSGCAVNPVTGQRELTLVSDQQAIAIGQDQYAPSQQMQGGVYHTDPKLNAYVNSVGQKLASHSGVNLPYEFVVLNNSVPNAWALPGGKIAVNRGLLIELKNEAELAAVLGHEVAHAAARHGAKRIERGLVTQGLLAVAALGATGLEYGGTVVGAAQQGAYLLNQKYSRDAEREADYYGTEFMAKAGYDPYAAVTLQETFVRLSGEQQQSWLQGWLASHPASTERVSNNRLLLKRLRQEGYTAGVFNQAEFASALQSLRTAQPAYEAYDEAQDAYANNQLDTALAKVGRAIDLYGPEAQFHGLRGAIRLKQKQWNDAITNFDRAIERDGAYFAYYLQRGIARQKKGDTSTARADLDRSVKLLPTSIAYQALGEIAESSGDMDSARRYYEQAGRASGSAGEAARASLVRLEIGEQPAKYVQADVVVDADNRYWLEVRNLTEVALKDVVVRVELTTADGVQSRSVRLDTLAASVRQRAALDTAPGSVLRAVAYAASASTL